MIYYIFEVKCLICGTLLENTPVKQIKQINRHYLEFITNFSIELILITTRLVSMKTYGFMKC